MAHRTKQQVFLGLACFAISTVFLFLPEAWAAQCSKETRNLKLGQGVAGVRSYICSTDLGPLVRVEFHRLDEISMASLFKGVPVPPLRQVLGEAPIEKNALFLQMADLFDRFGKQISYDAEWNYALSVPRGGSAGAGNMKGRPWRFGAGLFIPLSNAVATISKTLSFPPGFSFFYESVPHTDCHRYPLSCTILWRYMTGADAAGFDEDVDNYIKLLNIPGAAEDAKDVWKDNYLKMLVYIAKGNWPKYLEVMHGRYDECAEGFTFSYTGRDLLLDIAVIENVSGHEIALDGLWGVASRSDALRLTGGDSGRPDTLPVSTRGLPPGGKLAVPLQFKLLAQESSIDWNELAQARRVQKQIARGNKNQVVSASEWQRGFKKTRGSFKPPASPVMKNYVYGRSIDLKGLVVGGERLVLEGSSANYLEFTIAFEGGSCPFLYSWNDDAKTWDRHGQVIVRANDVSKKRTETIAFEGLKRRFQLREEELEITYLDRVSLTLHLDDGRTVTRMADHRKLVSVDGDYLLLHPGAVAELDFDTAGIEPGEVEESELIVTGFYRPYSSIMSRISSSIGSAVPVKEDGSLRR